MAEVGRNERCPCGSGKKFKHCCLLVKNQPSLETLTARRLGRLADWIAAKFRSQIPAQADEFYFEFDAEERNLLNSGTHAGSNGVSTLITDFICIDGIFELRGVKQSGLDWFLEAGGPLSLEDREFYEALSFSGLRAYRVVSVTEGIGIELLDLFDSNLECTFVHEKFGSTQLSVNDVIGARLIASDGAIHIAAMVPFHPEDGDLLYENYYEDLALVRAQAGISDDPDDDEFDADVEDEDEDLTEILSDTAAIELDVQSNAADLTLQLAPTEAMAPLVDDESDDDDDEALASLDESAMRDIVAEMTLQAMVAARVVSTYWLDSVLSSLRPDPPESAANE